MAVLRLSRILAGLLLSTATLLSIAPSGASCQHTTYNYGFDAEKRMARHRARQAAEMGPIPHVMRRAQGNILPRLEIRDLQKDHDVWMLYILALEQMQLTDQTVETSWYGITGIHGVPYKTWHGVGPVPGSEKTGYCAHSTVLFPTWHRPYLALYEQVVTDLMREISQWWPTGPERQRLEAAVARFRIPYWDWASQPPSGQSILPLDLTGQSKVWADGPNGLQFIDNPLFTYVFKPLNVTAFGIPPWDVWQETYRSPTTNDTRARSDNNQVAIGLNMAASSIRSRLYTLFANYDNYTEFSNNGWKPQQRVTHFDSLESLHDTVHTIAGGGGAGAPNPQGGHMAFIPYSAFDPLFFLHHCNVDRLFSLWQSIYTNAWIEPQRAVLASYTTRRGELVDSTTALTPFFVDSARGTFWTSDAVRDLTTFGYTYPELIGDSGGTISGTSNRGRPGSRAQAAQVKRAVNRLYGQSTPAGLFIQEMKSRKQQETASARPGAQPEPGRKYPASLFSEHGAKSGKGVVFTGNQYREWIVNVYTEKQLLDGSFAIHFFLGPEDSIPTDSKEWPQANNHVGTMGVFAAPTRMTNMAYGYGGGTRRSEGVHSRASHNTDISGTVPLTSKLVEMVISGELDDLSPGNVRKYLTQNLKKRVVTTDGQVVSHDDMVKLGRFGVSVVSAPVQAPYDDDELPVWGEVDVEFEVN